MYQALYRKYRSKTFDEIYGQDVIVKILKNAIINNKISHAYLFTGPRGTGKTSIAKIFANTINCLEHENGNPCGKCVYCTQKNKIDVLEIDAASNNGVDEIREIKEKIDLVPSIGKYKIYIIDEVHMLTVGAFNALLKTLEEPPEHAVFILATTDPYKIPATILSRCQRFDFKKISESKIYERLKYIISEENININDNAVKEISRLADGGMRDAISILDQVAAYSNENITEEDIHNINGTLTQYQLKEFIEDIINKNIKSIFEKISDFDQKGKNLIKLTEEIILFLKNILVNKKFDYDDLMYKEYINSFTDEELYTYITELNNSIYEMKKTSNIKLLLELTFIKLLDSLDNKNQEKPIIKQENSKTIEIKEETKKIDVKETKKIQKENNINTDLLEKLINIRISNTLANFNKKDIPIRKEEIKKLYKNMIVSKYGEYISMILDADIKATGSNNIIFLMNSSSIKNNFNNNLDKIDNLFKEELGKDYKSVAVDKEEWEIIKNNYNVKKIKYEEIDEKNLIEQIYIKNDNNEIESLFDEIVEYN